MGGSRYGPLGEGTVGTMGALWVLTTDGRLVNLAHVAQIRCGQASLPDRFTILAFSTLAKIGDIGGTTLGSYVERETRDVVFKHLALTLHEQSGGVMDLTAEGDNDELV